MGYAVVGSGLLATLLSLGSPEAAGARLRLESFDHLPFSFAGEAFARLEIVYHDQPGLAMAYYQPEIPAPTWVETSESGAVEAVETLANETPQPARLVLHRASFPETEAIVVASLPIDRVEHLAYALLVAHLHHQVEEGSAHGLWLRRLAGAEAGSDKDPDGEQRLGREILALASFGSHLLSLANEIERSEQRRQSRGAAGLCSLIERRLGLFMIWERAFDGDFLTSQPGPGGAMVAVGEGAKQGLLERVLENRFVGDAVADFGPRYCS